MQLSAKLTLPPRKPRAYRDRAYRDFSIIMDKKIALHFQKVDPILYKALTQVGGDDIELKVRKPSAFFEALCSEIIGQQLSGKAAETIYNRVAALFPRKKLTAKALLKIKAEKLRSAGLSWSKASFLKDLATRVLDGQLKLNKLLKLDHQEVRRELMAVKGIGPWTCEMFLMFSLGWPDFFSPGDAGLRRAMEQLYKIKNLQPARAERIAQKWAPYRTYACRILWKWLDND